jgi:hypothetical protein
MLSKKKSVAILDAKTDPDTGYSLIYSCATDWWLFGIPRYTENAWLLSRTDTIGAALLEDLTYLLKR